MLHRYLGICKIELKMRVVILHNEFGLQTILRIPFKSDDKHSRVLGTIVIHWLSTFKYLNSVQKFTDPPTMSHCEHLYVLGILLLTLFR